MSFLLSISKFVPGTSLPSDGYIMKVCQHFSISLSTYSTILILLTLSILSNPVESIELIQNGGFESGNLDNWIGINYTSDIGGLFISDIVTGQIHSGSYSMNARGPEINMLYQTVYIPSEGTLILSFWYKVTTGASSPVLFIVTDQTYNPTYARWSDNGTVHNWEKVSLDLSSVTNGSNHDIGWYFSMTSSVSYFIDTINLTYIPPSPSVTLSMTPTNSPSPSVSNQVENDKKGINNLPLFTFIIPVAGGICCLCTILIVLIVCVIRGDKEHKRKYNHEMTKPNVRQARSTIRNNDTEMIEVWTSDGQISFINPVCSFNGNENPSGSHRKSNTIINQGFKVDNASTINVSSASRNVSHQSSNKAREEISTPVILLVQPSDDIVRVKGHKRNLSNMSITSISSGKVEDKRNQKQVSTQVSPNHHKTGKSLPTKNNTNGNQPSSRPNSSKRDSRNSSRHTGNKQLDPTDLIYGNVSENTNRVDPNIVDRNGSGLRIPQTYDAVNSRPKSVEYGFIPSVVTKILDNDEITDDDISDLSDTPVVIENKDPKVVNKLSQSKSEEINRDRHCSTFVDRHGRGLTVEHSMSYGNLNSDGIINEEPEEMDNAGIYVNISTSMYPIDQKVKFQRDHVFVPIRHSNVYDGVEVDNKLV